jgi:hypothetical protein
MSILLPIERTWDGRPTRPKERVDVRLTAASGVLEIEVDAPLGEDPCPRRPTGPTDQLWEHEVVELFVVDARDRYTEIELGPWGHHLVLQLSGPRVASARCLPLEYRARIDGPRWTGLARLAWDLLPPAPHRVNAFAIRRIEGARRFFAWSPVAGARPDFHRIELFPTLELPRLDGESR